jgi:uncharacterized membrane protein YozB (DUF420 family)
MRIKMLTHVVSSTQFLCYAFFIHKKKKKLHSVIFVLFFLLCTFYVFYVWYYRVMKWVKNTFCFVFDFFTLLHNSYTLKELLKCSIVIL